MFISHVLTLRAKVLAVTDKICVEYMSINKGRVIETNPAEILQHSQTGLNH